MSLQEIAEALQQRIDFMAKLDDFEWEAWLACYNALIACKQAQNLASISESLETIKVRLEDIEGAIRSH